MSAGSQQTVPEQLLAVAMERPSSTAVDDGQRRFSYAELMEAAQQVAASIEGVVRQQERLVALSAVPSFETVAAIVGILLSGQIYLPIDPRYPEKHRSWIAADAAPALFIQETSDNPQERITLRDLFVGSLRPVNGRSIQPDAAAYAIYTSGSSGKAKGVINSHRGLANLCLNFIEIFEISSDSRVALLAPLSFDASVAEIFPTLASGATLCIPEATSERFGADLAAFLDRYAVTHVTATPSAWSTVPSSVLPSIQRIILAGEHPPERLIARWVASHPVSNAYGPTEASVCAMVKHLKPGDRATLGQPLRSVEVDVVGPDLSSVAEGEEGELVIAGEGLARGYLGRPDLTAQRFVPAAPFGREGVRMYRTGDRVKRLPGGEFMFRGRLDRQAKVRGFRIEPGEIEEKLLAHPAVKQAAVVLRPQEGQIRAYIACETVTEIAGIRSHLDVSLPAHAVPTQLIRLSCLPLGPSGKVDYAELAELDRARSAITVETEGTVEDHLAGIWSEILGLSQVDRDQSVFEQGAHSLAVERAAARMRATMGVTVSARNVFESSSIRSLGQRIEDGEFPVGPAPSVYEPAFDQTYSSKLAHQQRWMLGFLTGVEASPPFFRLGTTVAVEGDIGIEQLDDAIAAVVCAQDSFHLAFDTFDGDWRKSKKDIGFRLPRHQLIGTSENVLRDRIRQRLEGDCASAVNLSAPPLGRFRLFQVADQRYVIALACHHLTFDAFSFRIFFESVDRVLRGEPPISGRYEDFISWQHDRIAEGRHEADLGWWESYLEGALSAARNPLPGNMSVQYGPVSNVAVRLVNVSASVRRLAVRQGTTPFAVLLAAYAMSLARYCDNEDMVIAVPSAGRSEAAFDEVVGYFSNNLLLRLRTAPRKKFVDLLEELQADLLDAGERGAVHWDEVSRRVTGSEELGRVKMGLYPSEETILPPSTDRCQWSLLGSSVPRPERSDLHLILADEEVFSGELAYRPEVVSTELARQLARRFEETIARACANPTSTLERICEPLSIGTGGPT